MSSFDENTQLTLASGYVAKQRMLFGKPKRYDIPNSALSYLRVPIGTRNLNGSSGNLIFKVPRSYSFGLSANHNMQTNVLEGYSLPLCLQGRDGPTVEEAEFIRVLGEVVDTIKEWLLEHRDEVEKYELEAADLKKLDPTYLKKEKGKVVAGAGPVLYPKVMVQKKRDKKGGKNDAAAASDESGNNSLLITTIFKDEKGTVIDPLSTLGKPGHATAAVQIESIFVGARISIQVKLYEVKYEFKDKNRRSLLDPDMPLSDVSSASAASAAGSATASGYTNPNMYATLSSGATPDDTGSINGDSDNDDADDDDDDGQAAQAAPAPVVVAPVPAAPAAAKKPAAATVVRRVAKK